MAKDELRFGGGSFQQLTGCRPEHVRIMAAMKIIHPTTTDKGHRQFSPADVRAARVWMRENFKPRRKRA
jgi:hypothetical protein